MAAVMAESSVLMATSGFMCAYSAQRRGRAIGTWPESWRSSDRQREAHTQARRAHCAVCDGGAQREEARRGEDCIDDGVGHRRAGGIRNKERNVPPSVGRDGKLELEASKASWRVARISLVKCECEGCARHKE